MPSTPRIPDPVALRPVRVSDAGELFPMIHRSPVTDTILWDGPESLESYRAGFAERVEGMARGEIHLFTVVENATGKAVGSIDIRPMARDPHRGDIGLWVGVPYHGKGYGTSAVRQILDYGFGKLGLAKIEAYVYVGNLASRRIFEKNGFQLEGTLRKGVCKRGKLLDEWMLGILREERVPGL